MDSIELKARTKRFALRILALVDALPNSIAGREIGRQVVRSGMSVAANYRAACRARSRAEFLAKLGVVEEEADETSLWLDLIGESKLVPENLLKPLRKESNEIVAIIVASIRTARGNRKK